MGLTADLTLACNETNRGALANIYLAEACGITSFTAGALQDFTAVTMDTTADVFYKYEGEFKTKGLEGTGTTENGTATFEVVVTSKVLGLDKTKLLRLQQAIDSRKITAVIETTNSAGTTNKAFVVGWDNIIGAEAAGVPNVNFVIEPTLDGDNSATFTITATHAELPREMVGSINLSSGTATFGT